MSQHASLTGADLHAPGAHKTQHEDGGSDEISVEGLSGTLADPQTPAAHAIGSHSDVNAPTPSNGDRLTWDSGTSKWINSSATTGYTDEQAQDAVGAMIADTATVDLTYTDATPELKADVKDNSITFAKMADMNTGKLLGRSTASSGDPEEISVGTGLTLSSGTLSASGGGGSGYVMREEHTASTSSSLDFTTWYSSSYEDYVIRIHDLITASNTELGVQFSVDGGSTWLASTNYEFWGHFDYSGGNDKIGSAGTSRYSLRQGSSTTLLANCGYNARIELQNPGSSLHKFFYAETGIPDNSVNLISIRTNGRVKTTSAINGIRIIADTGNLTSGTVRVFGIAKA